MINIVFDFMDLVSWCAWKTEGGKSGWENICLFPKLSRYFTQP